MKKYVIQLNQIEQAKIFNITVTHFDVDIDLVRGRYTIDAKSLMGIFSLDLSKPLDLIIHTEDDNLAYSIVTTLKEKGIDINAA